MTRADFNEDCSPERQSTFIQTFSPTSASPVEKSFELRRDVIDVHGGPPLLNLALGIGGAALVAKDVSATAIFAIRVHTGMMD